MSIVCDVSVVFEVRVGNATLCHTRNRDSSVNTRRCDIAVVEYVAQTVYTIVPTTVASERTSLYQSNLLTFLSCFLRIFYQPEDVHYWQQTPKINHKISLFCTHNGL